MCKAVLLVLMLIFASTISAAEKPAQKSDKAKKIMDNYVAVFDLEVTDGINKSISRPLSESIRREIVSTKKYEVIVEECG